jgi:class 3 adenylate cyclase
VRYDIYGPDVNIANKMESNGVEGQVHVSETTKALLERYCPDLFKFQFLAKVEAKQFGRSVDGYIIQSSGETVIDMND